MNAMTNLTLAAAIIGMSLGTAVAVIQNGPDVLSLPAMSFHQAHVRGNDAAGPTGTTIGSPGAHTGLFM